MNDRQVKALLFVKEHRRITNKEFHAIDKAFERKASHELSELIKANLLEQVALIN